MKNIIDDLVDRQELNAQEAGWVRRIVAETNGDESKVVLNTEDIITFLTEMNAER